jgi:hypothetical protein
LLFLPLADKESLPEGMFPRPKKIKQLAKMVKQPFFCLVNLCVQILTGCAVAALRAEWTGHNVAG